jgi:hypothetical protein
VLKQIKTTWHIVLGNVTGFCETTARYTSALNTLKGYIKKQIPYIFRKKDTTHNFEKNKVFILVK